MLDAMTFTKDPVVTRAACICGGCGAPIDPGAKIYTLKEYGAIHAHCAEASSIVGANHPDAEFVPASSMTDEDMVILWGESPEIFQAIFPKVDFAEAVIAAEVGDAEGERVFA